MDLAAVADGVDHDALLAVEDFVDDAVITYEELAKLRKIARQGFGALRC